MVAAAMLMQAGQAQLAKPATPRVACTAAAIAANVPTGWDRPTSVPSGSVMGIGHAAMVAMRASPTAGFVAPPAKPAAMGAIVTVVVPRAGRWRVSLDMPMWLDVVSGDRSLAASVAHAHGPACSGIAKMVDFDLPAGRYVLQLSGTTGAPVRVMIAPA